MTTDAWPSCYNDKHKTNVVLRPIIALTAHSKDLNIDNKAGFLSAIFSTFCSSLSEGQVT